VPDGHVLFAAGGLATGRAHDCRASSITGTYSNGGAVSYTIRATNVSGSTDRVFTGTITEIWDSLAEVDFTLDLNGSATLNIDLDTYAPGPTVPPLSYTVRAWPGTIAQSGARNNVVSGSVSATQAKTAYDVVATDGYVGGGGDNFVAAAAEASAYWTERFPDAASVSSYMLADGTEGRASRQTASPPPGATGFMRFAIPNSDGTNSGELAQVSQGRSKHDRKRPSLRRSLSVSRTGTRALLPHAWHAVWRPVCGRHEATHSVVVRGLQPD
jgi:hypothetical protein